MSLSNIVPLSLQLNRIFAFIIVFSFAGASEIPAHDSSTINAALFRKSTASSGQEPQNSTSQLRILLTWLINNLDDSKHFAVLVEVQLDGLTNGSSRFFLELVIQPPTVSYQPVVNKNYGSNYFVNDNNSVSSLCSSLRFSFDHNNANSARSLVMTKLTVVITVFISLKISLGYNRSDGEFYDSIQGQQALFDA